MFTELILIVLLLLLYLYWSDAQQTREIALRATRAHCQKMQVQMLDDYVALNALWLKKDGNGKLLPWRSYLFEFSSTGMERYNGRIIMLGRRIQSIRMEPYRINTDHE